MKFNEFSLQPDLLKGLESVGYNECMPVQSGTYPQALKGADVLVQSQTGSGKTAAFLVTIYHRMLTDPSLKNRQALIVAPTRELAVQIEKEANKIGKYLPLKTGCFYGGVGYAQQEKKLQDGVDIIIGTPGRLIDFSSSGKIKLTDVSIVVIDEADRLFDMGFLPDLRRMMRKMVDPKQRQTMLFSATLSHKVKALASEYMNQPYELMLSPDSVTVEQIDQVLYHLGSDEKMSVLIAFLSNPKLSNALIFTNMKHTALRVSKRLNMNGFRSEYLSGDQPQRKRLRILDDFKAGRVHYLVATDVAARGLHVDGLELVVNYDLPQDPENYVHRIGRTARAGKEGKAITFACEKFVFGLDAIEKFIKMKIPVGKLTDSMFADDKSSGVRIPSDDLVADRRQERGPRTPTSPKKITKEREPKSTTEPRKQNEPTKTRSNTPVRERQPRSMDWDRFSRESQRLFEDYEPLNMPNENDRLDYYRRKYGDSFTKVTAVCTPDIPIKR